MKKIICIVLLGLSLVISSCGPAKPTTTITVIRLLAKLSEADARPAANTSNNNWANKILTAVLSTGAARTPPPGR